MTIDEIRDNFELLEEWDDRYRYVIELGRTLDPMPEAEHSAANKVNGCVSQVWLLTSYNADRDPILEFQGDSDAHIVRGLVAIMMALFSGRRASEILRIDAEATLREFGLDEHLSPQRANGLRAIIKRIKREAGAAVAGVAAPTA